MSEQSRIFPTNPQWEGPGTHRVPFLAYISDDIYKRELERFFYRGHW